MNREQKRLLQRQGEVDADGQPKAAPRKAAPAPRPKEQRTPPRQFYREVRQELRKVAWPTRAETIHYSIIVFITLVLLTALISVLDFGVSKAVLWIFE